MGIAALAIVVVVCSMCMAEGFYFFRMAKTFPLDENSRLKDHWLVHSNNPSCHEFANKLWNYYSGSGRALRLVASVDSPVSEEIFGEDSKAKCMLGLLDRGTRSTLLQHVIPEKIWDASAMDLADSETSQWLTDWGIRLELGFISYHRSPIDLYWVSDQGARHHVGHLKRGEKHVIWQHTSLGHNFELVDTTNGETMHSIVALHDGMIVAGGRGGSYVDPYANFTLGIQETLRHELYRAHSVTRTYTEFGFSRSRLPQDIWASMDAYYYNNRNVFCREEWEDKGYYVNWWERDAYIIQMPWDLKRYWQRRLQDLVTDWIGGTELEMTDIYGMRRYEEGARLLTHVDRTSTHATSMIINIDQGRMREPWMVEIYDFAGRLHLVSMEPGDIVFYESARALHGRMKPLRGEYYVNVFTHYRPKGDPEWHSKPNPANGVKQLHDIGTCHLAEAGHVECSEVHAGKIPFLSPNMETVTKDIDLFNYWQAVSPEQAELEQFMAGAAMSASSVPTSAMQPPPHNSEVHGHDSSEL